MSTIENMPMDEGSSWHSTQLQFFFFIFGLGLSVKIAIYPQVMPFIVKDEMRLESACAYNQSIDHLLTSMCLLAVGLFSLYHPGYTYLGTCLFLVALSAVSLYFYVALYLFDRDKKGSLLDLKPLGQSKQYIDMSRQKLHTVQLNSDNKGVILSPLLGTDQACGGFATSTAAQQRQQYEDNLRRLDEIESLKLRVPQHQRRPSKFFVDSSMRVGAATGRRAFQIKVSELDVPDGTELVPSKQYAKAAKD